MLGTALASTLLLATVATPIPAQAVATCDLNPPDVPASPGRIDIAGESDDIFCINTEPRVNDTGNAINLSTINPDHFIYLNNSGGLTAENPVGNANGILARTFNPVSPVEIVNSGDITATGQNGAFGIYVDSQRSRRPHQHLE